MDNKPNGHGLVLNFDAKPFSRPEPGAQRFNGAEILDGVSEFIRRFVHLSDQQARIVAAWVAHTHAVGAATTTPYLNVNASNSVRRLCRYERCKRSPKKNSDPSTKAWF